MKLCTTFCSFDNNIINTEDDPKITKICRLIFYTYQTYVLINEKRFRNYVPVRSARKKPLLYSP